MILQKLDNLSEVLLPFGSDLKTAVIKPNWVDNKPGNFTEPEILDWFCRAWPGPKMVVESYTPWRGGHQEIPGLKTDLEGGREFWDFYRKMDENFLEATGLASVLSSHHMEYVNVTNEYWSGNTVDSSAIKEMVEKKYDGLYWPEFYSFVPSRLFERRNDSVFVSLAKVKMEEGNGNIVVSLSMKNLFGLIPHPSRRDPYHQNGHAFVAQAIVDINKVYCSVFGKTCWVNEAVKSLVKNYCEDTQSYERDLNLAWADSNPVQADREICLYFGVDPKKVPHLRLAEEKGFAL